MTRHRKYIQHLSLALALGLGSSGIALARTDNFSSREVRQAQMELKDAGYFYGRIDGRMDRDTQWAIRQWQREKHLPMTGQLDSRTMRSLRHSERYGEASRSIDEHYGNYHNDQRR
jgi:peptidoglycan hydrolase-like protein with peptidoglycan-binding domain